MTAATPKTTRATLATHAKKPVAAKDQKPAKAAVAPSKALKQDTIESAKARHISPGVEKSAKKARSVRDSFIMPEVDYGKLAALKSKCLAAGVSVKKSELLRIGLHLLETLPTARLKAAVTALESVKTGRKAVKASKKGKLAKLH